MVQQKKRKSRTGSTPSRRVRSNVVESDYSDEGEGSGTPISQPEAELAEVALAYEVGNSEWDVLFDLTGIPGPLQASMLAVAPTLAGHEAQYEDCFFSQQVGLCDKGAMVNDIGKVYPHILESDIKEIWRVGSQANRFEIMNCTDKEQAWVFSKHCYEVYGHSPDNTYYSMRFLKGATTTFVHGLDVNWVAEAQGRRSKRIATALKNPRKLGPIALRCQVEGLCGIIKGLSGGSPSPPTLPPSVDAAQKAAFDAAAVEASAAKGLRAIQMEKDDVEAVLEKCTPEDLATVEAEHAAALLEQKRLFYLGTQVEYKAQVEVVRASSEKLAELQEVVMTARFTIQHLAVENGPLSMAYADQKQTKVARVEADAALKKAKQDNMTLRPRSLFPYVDRQSVPTIDGVILKEWCPMCSKEFVA